MKIRLGTRGSKLALIQAEAVSKKLQNLGCEVEIIKIKTKGDKIKDVPLSEIGGKGLFVKELEKFLLKDEIDIAVHSLKDMLSNLPEGLKIGAVLEREDPRDVFISRDKANIKKLPDNFKIGTSSLRRKVQILYHFPKYKIEPIRGNLDTRIRKLKEKLYDGIIVASAGVKRLNLENELNIQYLDFMLPAINQGIIAVEVKEERKDLINILSKINHLSSFYEAIAERSFLKHFGGGCQIPIAALAKVKDNFLTLKGAIFSLDAKRKVDGEISGKVEEAEELGKNLALKILSSGGWEILAEIKKRFGEKL